MVTFTLLKTHLPSSCDVTAPPPHPFFPTPTTCCGYVGRVHAKWVSPVRPLYRPQRVNSAGLSPDHLLMLPFSFGEETILAKCAKIRRFICDRDTILL
ncbi:hypothetical protein CEXT_36581 [Caerostris extrusa]|uniref:Uncharacterized protein n=1 Tax=Caerostris extrusa TaxID=172846 RepID=A0AAV4NKF5_CAEEX|nr:hypothetical protein CEXT_36581 [Caerostris extrusa]